MLSAFRAQPVVELKASQKFKIESLLAYGDRLLVGLSTGHLRVYRFNEAVIANLNPDPSFRPTSASDAAHEDSKSKSRPVDLLREEEEFSRKAVQQLAIVKEAGILISLSDNYVSFHDLQTFELSERLTSTKGASTFAVMSHVVKDDSTGIPSIVSKLAVAVKRKLLVWSWQDSELITDGEEITLAAPIKSITWSQGNKIIAGMDPGYVLLDIETKGVTEIHKPLPSNENAANVQTRFGAVGSSGMNYVGMGSWIPKPMAAKLSESELVLARDVNTLFVDENGKPLEKRQIPWVTAPEAVGYSYPYLLSLQPTGKGTLEVRNPNSLSLLQSISLPQAVLLHVPQPNISLAHAGKGFLVASDRCIWRMGAIGYDSQIKDLTSKERYDEAISLIDMLEDTLLYEKKDLRLRDVRIMKAQSLFDLQKYREALELFSTALAPPEKVIMLYPETISGSLVQPGSSKSANGSNTKSSKAHDSDSRRSSEGQNASTQGRSNTSTGDTALLASKAEGLHKENSRENSKADYPKLEGRELTFAVNELCAYLAQVRVQLQRYVRYDGTLKSSNLLLEYKESRSQDTQSLRYLLSDFLDEIDTEDQLRKTLLDTATLVDTTLFRAYMLTRPRLAGSLFRLDNFCAPKVVEEKLYETGRYKDLIEYLQGKKLHREALDLLQKFGKDNTDEKIDDEMHGPARTVNYLQQLPFELVDLILEYAKWPLEVNPALGMRVFLADTENAESLPRSQVVKFLSKFDSNLTIQYLEHIINDLEDDTQYFHEMLIDLYLEKLSNVDDENKDIRESIQKNLELFLQKSSHFSESVVVKKLPQNVHAFFESRAILHSRLSQHSKALIIYVFELQDDAKAEEYCNRTYASATSSTPSTTLIDPDDPSSPIGIYITLLSLYLDPPSPHEKNFDAALALLSRHGSRLPAYSALDLLPGSLPIKELYEYFLNRMRTATSLAREQAIINAMSSVESARAEAQLRLGGADPTTEIDNASPAAGLNRRIVITDSKLCNVCHKRLGRSAIRVWPDGEIVHYGCNERRRLGRSGSGTVMT